MGFIKRLLGISDDKDVDTRSEFEILKSKIYDRETIIRNNVPKKPMGRKRCKDQEDIYVEYYNKANIELKLLKEEYKKICIMELNKFTLNRSCTIEFIADKLNIESEILWDILIDSTDYIEEKILYYGKCNNYYTLHFNIISELELGVKFDYIDYELYEHEYKKHEYKYEEQNDEYIHKCTMKLPNWSFVASENDYIFYVERTS